MAIKNKKRQMIEKIFEKYKRSNNFVFHNDIVRSIVKECDSNRIFVEDKNCKHSESLNNVFVI